MSYKKILIVSPEPTHPPNQGHRARILNLCQGLKNKGAKIDFLLMTSSKDKKFTEMEKFFGKSHLFIHNNRRVLFKQKIYNLFHQLYKNNIVRPERAYNYKLDDFFDNSVKKLYKRILKENTYDMVIVEYVFLSKILEYTPNNIIQVIDSHDIFANRWKIFIDIGVKPHWYSISSEDEIKGLNRAEIIIAIQNNEKLYFESVIKKEVICIPHKIKYFSSTFRGDKILLFLGSNNKPNILSMKNFLDNCFPEIIKVYPSIKLLIGGSICNHLEEYKNYSNLKLFGRVDKLEDFYEMGDIVISPIVAGTGLKIKNIEALSFSKFLITSRKGAEGLEEGFNKAFLIADSPEEYIDVLKNLFENEKRRHIIQEEIKMFITNWNEKFETNISTLLNK